MLHIDGSLLNPEATLGLGKKPGFRIPTGKGGYDMKDRTRYTRKQKHKRRDYGGDQINNED